MAKKSSTKAYITAPAGTALSLRLTSKFGAVIAAAYELARVGTPPVRIEQRTWNDLDFHKANPRTWDLPAGLPAGDYLVVVVPVLQPPKTELEIALLQAGVVVLARTAYADKPTHKGIAIFNLTLT